MMTTDNSHEYAYIVELPSIFFLLFRRLHNNIHSTDQKRITMSNKTINVVGWHTHHWNWFLSGIEKKIYRIELSTIKVHKLFIWRKYLIISLPTLPITKKIDHKEKDISPGVFLSVVRFGPHISFLTSILSIDKTIVDCAW